MILTDNEIDALLQPMAETVDTFDAGPAVSLDALDDLLAEIAGQPLPETRGKR